MNKAAVDDLKNHSQNFLQNSRVLHSVADLIKALFLYILPDSLETVNKPGVFPG